MMSQIRFPSEIQVFERLMSSSTLKMIGDKLSTVDVSPSEIKLADWYKILTDLQIENEINSATFWALTAKLAWILADVEFFNSKSSLLVEFKNSPVLTCYFATGITEFINFDKGLQLFNENFKVLRTEENIEVLLDLAIPYALFLNNSYNSSQVKILYYNLLKLVN